jgi:hypothetical protein
MTGILGSVCLSQAQSLLGISLLRANQYVSLLSLFMLGMVWSFLGDRLLLLWAIGMLGFINVSSLFLGYELAVE